MRLFNIMYNFNKTISLLLLILLVKPTVCQRRIVKGHTTNVNATFMVYILPEDYTKYNEWMCGGAIVDRWFVLTSAACLVDMKAVYVVSGYDTYLSSHKRKTNNCVINMNKTIVSWCYQSHFKLGEYKTRDWTVGDIALAKVDTPFNFKDPSYLKYCSYYPSIIDIGFDDFYRKPGAPVITYGWGHRKFIRPHANTWDYNSPVLHYPSTRIISTKECLKQYPQKEVKIAIKSYGICTSGPGYLNDEGHLINLQNRIIPFCSNTTCAYRRLTRRQNLCQNDHGAPLLTWYGGRRYLIGVATGFLVNKHLECVSPSLFTSTACTAKFLQCMLSQTRRYESCAIEKGIRITVKSNKNLTELRSKIKSNKNLTALRSKIKRSSTTKRSISSTEELFELYDLY